MSTDLGLRERKKQQTRLLLSETARRLFAERGFEAVSVAEVARAADVSEATVFNYFPTKEDLFYSGLERFEEELLTAIRERPPGETFLAAFGRFVLQPRGLLAAKDDAAAEHLVEVSRMVARSPALLAREREIFDRYSRSLAALIAEETGARDDDPSPAVAANALLGVHRAMIEHVRRHLLADDPDLARIRRGTRAAGMKALALLEGGLGGYGVR
jgi:AcrR family transcriptional regulator